MKSATFIIMLLFLMINCGVDNLTDIERRYLTEDQGKNKYYLIEFIRDSQQKNKLGEIPMVIVDGTPYTYNVLEEHKKLDISKFDIKRIEIMEIEKSIPLYGKAGKHGVITIYTH